MNKFLIMLFCFSLLFCLGSCSETPAPEITPPDNTQQTPEEEKTPVEDENPTIPEPQPTPVPVKREIEVCIPEDRDLRVIQLADIHFGIEGKDWHNDKVDRTKLYIASMIQEEKPDLIVCSGDNILSTGVKGLTNFIDYIETFEIPWIWLYGNHDAESTAAGYKKSDLSKALESADTKYLMYKSGYVEATSENRYGNFSVPIYNSDKSKLLGAFIVMDSGEYDYSAGKYQAITSGQIEWYKSEIDALQEKYAVQSDNKYEIIPTIVFSHIQLPEYKTAYEKAVSNDGAEFVIEQQLSQNDISEIGSGGPKENTGFFDALVQKGSTKAYFVGHAHTMYFQVKYQGIVLGFGPQTGFSKLFANNDDPRKTYMYSFGEDLTFETKCVNEVVKNRGLVYTATSGNGNAHYNAEKGVYVFTAKFVLWSRVSLDYYGPELTSEYTRITLENTTITGEINKESTADWTTKLYCSKPDSGVFLCSKDATNIYRFTYNPTENTLHIEVVEEYIPDEGELAVLSVNKNSNLTVWKNSGFAVKSLKNWCTNDAMLYIVVDKDGRITYAVYNTNEGYGEPSSDTYYVHPYYTNDSEETTNKSIVVTDTGYKIVVPEGGFAISAKSSSLVTLLSKIYDPSIDDLADIIDLVFNKESFNENLRLYFDSENKVISTKFIG